MEYRIKDISLADKGKKKIEWAESNMPVLLSLKNKYKDSKPLRDIVVGGCLHVTKETAVLTKTLSAAGATVAWSGCNPLSTNDDIYSVLKFNPDITIDDGAALQLNFIKHLISTERISLVERRRLPQES